MSSLLNTVFSKRMELKLQEAQRIQAEQDRQAIQSQQQEEQLWNRLDRTMKVKREEFDRQMKVAQLQAQNLAMLGKQMPAYQDPAIAEGAKAAYTAGEAENQTRATEFERKLQAQQMTDAEAAYRKNLELQARAGEGEANRAQREQLARQALAASGSRFDRQLAQQRDLALMREKGMNERQTSGRGFDLDLQKLGKLQAPLAGMQNDLQILVEAANAPKGDRPGVGFFKGPMTASPYTSWMVGERDRRVRGAADRIFTDLLRQTSGAAVSHHEELRNLKARMFGERSGPEQFDEGVAQLARILKDIAVANTAGFRPEVRQYFIENDGLDPDMMPQVGNSLETNSMMTGNPVDDLEEP